MTGPDSIVKFVRRIVPMQAPSLGLKIFLALCLTLILVAYVATHLGLEQRYKQMNSRLKEQSRQTLQLLSAGALEPVISEDIAHLETLVLESARLDLDLSSISIFSKTHRELISWSHQDFASKQHNSYTFDLDIEFEGEKFGYVIAAWDPARLLKEIEAELVMEQKRLIFSLLILTSLILVLLRYLVVSPVNRLRARLEGLSLGNQYEALTIQSSREMSMLAEAVNELDKTMAESRNLSIELKYQASHDLLTGLTNRFSFEKHLKEHLQGRKRGQTESTLLYIDLDQFKLVNDTCGHAAGDALLVQLSSILKEHISNKDVFARLGGDEFSVLLINTPLQEGLTVAENIRVAAQAFRFSWDGRSFAVETSIGAVPISSENDNSERILTAADEACYAAKNQGRNRIVCYQEDDEELANRLDQGGWVPRIIDALENSRLVLYGQPIEPADGQQTQGAHLEILVRMLESNNELVPPGAFLPAAERYGLMPQIDRFVVIRTLEWLSNRIALNHAPPICAINISGHSICDPDFRKFAYDTLTEHPHLCSQISFEITETAAVANLASAVAFMEKIKALGCSFALDDFGTGMSSFTYLKNLPVDYIKIDGAFVQNLLVDQVSLAMVRAMADIAGVMQIRSIAEFVENDEIRNRLLEIGIDYVQGFGVAKPALLTEHSTLRIAA